MRYHHISLMQVFICFNHKFKNGIAGLLIQVPSRLVSQNDRRLCNQCSRNCNTLLLPSRQLIGVKLQPLFKLK